MSLKLFTKGLDKHIAKTFGTFIKHSCAENQAIVSKHLEARVARIKDGDTIYNNSTLRIEIPKVFSKRYILKYSILSWYLDPYTQFELQEFLRKICTNRKELFDIRFLYLDSKEIMIYTLFRENDCSTSHLFGNILTNGVYEQLHYKSPEGKSLKKKVFTQDKIKIYEYLQPKAKKLAFKRGYDDHGSLTPEDEKGRKKANMESNAFEKEVEKQIEELRSMSKLEKFILEIRQGIDL